MRRSLFMGATAAAAIIGASVATPAAAHWQWTKWGMTPAQVIAASGGKAVMVSNSSEWLVRIDEPYSLAGFTFDKVAFGFTDGKLTGIRLYTKSNQFMPLERALASVYGKAVVSDNDPSYGSRQYVDSAKGNAVRLHKIGEALFLDYTPIPTGF